MRNTDNQNEELTQDEQEAPATAVKLASLEDILALDDAELATLKTDTFETDKLGVIGFTAIDHTEFKEVKKACFRMVKNGTGGMEPEVDDDKMNLRLIVDAVAKDKQSNFTFADNRLQEKLKVKTAEQAVAKALSPGEITRFSAAIQTISGFGPQASKQRAEKIKNS